MATSKTPKQGKLLSKFKIVRDLNTETVEIKYLTQGEYQSLWTFPLGEWLWLIAHPEIIPLPEPVEAESEDHILGHA